MSLFLQLVFIISALASALALATQEESSSSNLLNNSSVGVLSNSETFNSWLSFWNYAYYQGASPDKGFWDLIDQTEKMLVAITGMSAPKNFYTRWGWSQLTAGDDTNVFNETMELMSYQYAFFAHSWENDHLYIKMIHELLNSNVREYASALKLLKGFSNFDFGQYEKKLGIKPDSTNIGLILAQAGILKFAVAASFDMQLSCGDKVLMEFGCDNGGGFDESRSRYLEYSARGGIKLVHNGPGPPPPGGAELNGYMNEDGVIHVTDDSDPQQFYSQLPNFFSQLGDCRTVSLNGQGETVGAFTTTQGLGQRFGTSSLVLNWTMSN